jgi:(E)-4-hydroxy-3-methylbut-2-enyl-diphosphate synthase
MDIKRHKTRTVKIGGVSIGSGHPIAIQSMVKTSAKNVAAATAQIKGLEAVGCEIVRLAVEDQKDAQALKKIKRQTRIPLVADIHFDYRLALAAIDAGVDKVRLNPGNIFKPAEVRAVIAAAKSARIPIRVGANSGSLRGRSGDVAHRLVRSVREYVKIFEKSGFYDTVISLKASTIPETIAAYQEMARVCDYPLHVGITATGQAMDGLVKSSAGIGVLLFGGIGDTIRVSLLDDPRQEVAAAQLLLAGLGLRQFGPQWICCPTCGRCEVDLKEKAGALARWIERLSAAERARIRDLKIAVMGCVVNGPGEAREADLGIAFSKHKGMLFRRGVMQRAVPLASGEKALFELIRKEARR